MITQKVLLINDMAGYGKVALSAMIPVLSHLGISTYNLPTALVSNTLDYGKFDILETTDYMKNTLRIWDELDFSFDAISTGFIVNAEQAQIITDYCMREAQKGKAIFCDPIMGDDGSLYPGMGKETVENMKKLSSCAQYLMPNYTEACFLSGKNYCKNPSKEEVREIIDSLRDLGAKSVIITSVESEEGNYVACYDEREKRYFDLPYELIPVRFPGTGDIFSSVLLGCVMNGATLCDSVQKAMDAVYSMILQNKDNEDKLKGIEIEHCLGGIAR